MDRRTIITSFLTAAAFLTGRNARAEAERPATSSVPRVAYHLSESDKAKFVLGNISNHIKGMGGPDKVEIALVIHGPPLALFRADSKDDTVLTETRQLMEQGVTFFACVNTMNAMKLTQADLAPGFAVADKGAVVKLADLQGQGWLYLRP